jgi:hypothetical protein
MKLPTYQWFGQMLAATGVIISISLLAYEMKLARDIAKADVYAQGAAMNMTMVLSTMPSEQIRAAMEKRGRDEVLSEEETSLLVDHIDAWIFTVENGFYQYQLGLQGEDEWSVHRYSLKRYLAFPCYREVFNSARKGFRKDFAAEVEVIFAEIPKVDCILDIGQ